MMQAAEQNNAHPESVYSDTGSGGRMKEVRFMLQYNMIRCGQINRNYQFMVSDLS